MTDIVLLTAHGELTKILSNEKNDVQMSYFLLRYECGDVNDCT